MISTDFDGTIVGHAYPEIGKPILFAIETLLQLKEEGHRLTLWTVRRGVRLQKAVDYCAEQGLHFFAVNENYRSEKDELQPSDYLHKLKTEMFIDGRNLGGLPDWGVIYNAVKVSVAGGNVFQIMAMDSALPEPKNKKRWFW